MSHCVPRPDPEGHAGLWPQTCSLTHEVNLQSNSGSCSRAAGLGCLLFYFICVNNNGLALCQASELSRVYLTFCLTVAGIGSSPTSTPSTLIKTSGREWMDDFAGICWLLATQLKIKLGSREENHGTLSTPKSSPKTSSKSDNRHDAFTPTEL